MLRVLPTLAACSFLAMSAGTSHAALAQLHSTRSGETPRGATRVVFEVDRPVEYLTVELPSENGFEVHLLDVDNSTVPPSLSPRSGLIGSISFRSSPSGMVARLTGSDVRLTATTFALENPNRVVVDLRPQSSGLDQGAARKQSPVKRSAQPSLSPAGPTAVSKSDPTPSNVAKKAVAAINSAVNKLTGSSDDTAPEPERESEVVQKTPAAKTPPAKKPAASIFEDPDAQALAAKDPGTEEFEDLLVWIHVLQASVEALNEADNEADRAKYRRRLGHLLIQRGILREGEKALAAALASDGRNLETAVADSVTLAEVRFSLGDLEPATDVARNLDTARATPGERVRIAAVLLDTDNAVLAGTLLAATVDDCREPLLSRARLLLARSHWNRNETQEARTQIRRVTSSAKASPEVQRDAVLLHADCEFALGNNDEALALYNRAVTLDLTDENASWAGLQLGNLARRAGRHAEARAHWKKTTDQWPDTFYGTQAAWFLKFAEEMHKLSQAEAENSRG
ncbi:MAG: hypothetical protein DHS20C21_17470 [Gemmatimonadota bacterium]|nr:MAG: hypothetical protein DHS20C21_17470 [Gemmatimonadota bacterium]